MNDNREQLEKDIDYWLGKWPGCSVRIADIKAEIVKWLGRAADIRERELCALLEENGVHISHDGPRRITTVEVQRIYDQNVEIAELKAQLDRTKAERECYRSCFGEAVDKADEIRAIMAGMGMK